MKNINEMMSRSAPRVLYHYTSQEGLLGIVRSREIWASKIQFLNDRAEFVLALSLARGVLEDLRHKAQSERELQLMTKLICRFESVAQTNICVCSFSEEGDLLSQWRGYCPQGSGYSVGFNSGTLRDLAKEQSFLLVPCVYEESRQLQLIQELINEVFRLLPASSQEVESSDICKLFNISLEVDFSKEKPFSVDGIASLAIILFTRIAPAIKHRTFSEEKEWRLISSPIDSRNSRFSYRPGRSMIIRYYRFNLAHNNEKMKSIEVTVGPTPHKELAMTSISSFLGSCGHEGWSVKHSEIPYRGW